MLIFSTTWIHFENSMFNERNQTQKVAYYPLGRSAPWRDSALRERRGEKTPRPPPPQSRPGPSRASRRFLPRDRSSVRFEAGGVAAALPRLPENGGREAGRE